MIETFEIPKERWAGFVELINRRARDRPVRVEVEGRDLGDQEMGQLLPLVGLALETKGSERGDLLISVESKRGEILTHHINQPLHLYLTHNEAAEVEHLAVEEASGAKTLLHFQHLPMIKAGEAPELSSLAGH
jgi:hypothetical protein